MIVKHSTPGMRMVASTQADVDAGTAAVLDHVCLFQLGPFGGDSTIPVMGTIASMMVAEGLLAPAMVVSGYTLTDHFTLAHNTADGLCAYVWNTTWNPTTAADDAVVKHYKVPIDAAAMCATGINADGFPQNLPAIEALGAALFGPAELLTFLFVGRPVSQGWSSDNQFYQGTEDVVPHPHTNLAYLSADGVFTAQFGSHSMFRAPLSSAAAALVADAGNAAYFSVPSTQNFWYWDAHDGYTPLLRQVFDGSMNAVVKELYVYKTEPYNALTRKGFKVTGLDSSEFGLELKP